MITFHSFGMTSGVLIFSVYLLATVSKSATVASHIPLAKMLVKRKMTLIMRKYLLVFGIIILFGFKTSFQISGKYKIVYDNYSTNEKADCIIDFRTKDYTKQTSEDSIIGGITRINSGELKTIIHLRDFVYGHPRAEVNNTKQKGNVVIEFQESELDTIIFRTTYTKQLERTLNTGKLIKIK